MVLAALCGAAPCAVATGCQTTSPPTSPPSGSLVASATVSIPAAATVSIPASATGSAGSSDADAVLLRRLACPPPEPDGTNYPPWQLRHHFERCIRGAEGRWSVERDASDPDGWRHHLTFEGVEGQDVRVEVTSPTGLARRIDGKLVLLDLKEGVTLFALDGSVVWRATHPSCGAVHDVAVGWDDAITFTCGRSVVRLDAQGTLLWQRWPFGNTSTGGPWVARDGTLYVSGNGRVAALEPSGDVRWSFPTGSNRAVGRLVWNARGNLVFDTGMAAMHSNPDETNGLRIYFPSEPNELFELSPAGALVSRTPYPSIPPPGGWPAVLPVPADGSHRVP